MYRSKLYALSKEPQKCLFADYFPVRKGLYGLVFGRMGLGVSNDMPSLPSMSVLGSVGGVGDTNIHSLFKASPSSSRNVA